MTQRTTPRAKGVRIAGTGFAVPQRVLTNQDLASMVDTSDEWITQRTGIKTRFLADEETRTSDLATDAVRMALDNAGIDKSELDLLILATMTPDMICPAAAATVVRKLDAIPCGAFDINIACTGFIAALNIGSSMIETGLYRNVAVIAADKLSDIVDWNDRRTCILFGDAASAAILTASDDETQGCLYQTMGSDGERGQALFVPRKESDIPAGEEETFSGAYDKLQMNGRAVYKFAVQTLAECVEEAMTATGIGADDITMVVPHQSNIRMLESAWKRLGFKQDKVLINIDRYGNTSAASAGIALHEAFDTGRIKAGDHIIFVAQGGGLSWGSSLWKL